MKARIKATGTIVEVEGLFDVGTALVNGRYFKVSELDFFDNFETIDWEQRRYELAKSAMQGYCIALGINDDSESRRQRQMCIRDRTMTVKLMMILQ